MAGEYQESSESSSEHLPEIAWSWDDESQTPGECIVLPKICISCRYLDELTAECLDAIMLQNDPPSVFQRNGSLARLKNLTDSKMEIEVVNKDMLIGIMARSASFVDAEDNPVYPPKGVASDILSMPSWEIPTISGVVSTPVLRKDGTILTSPGYDKASGLYYSPSPSLYVPEIKEEPTKEDAVQAAKYLLTEVFGVFPYVDRHLRPIS